MCPPKVAFIAPREESRTQNDTVSRVPGSLVTRLTSRGAMEATFVGNVKMAMSSEKKSLSLNPLALKTFAICVLLHSCRFVRFVVPTSSLFSFRDLPSFPWLS